jgi:hypothetical protein
MAAFDEHAGCEHDADTLCKLSDYFEVYVDALNEMSQQYIMGFDLALVADKMLDHFNRYRTLADEGSQRGARRYAEMMGVGPAEFRALYGGA